MGVLLLIGVGIRPPELRSDAAVIVHSTAPEFGSQPPVAARLAAPLQPDVTILAAGDIASCDATGDEKTAAILAVNPGIPVLALGDQAYPDGTAADYRDCFDPSWGSHKTRIHPVPGNHEYHSANAGPYFAYFGAAAGPSGNTASRGYYSFDLGPWHIVALNSEQDVGPDGAQVAWLRADLAATDKKCTLAFWHRPRFTKSLQYTDALDVKPFWQELYAAGAEIVLNGHEHNYQRYRPMNPDGAADPAGIREFVVGTGGRAAHQLLPDSRREAEHTEPGFAGVLRLNLSETGYDWSVLPVAGETYSDAGSGDCN